jgi:hypothetical protein
MVASTLRVERTKRLGGSRFVTWQLYGLLAGGSRERLEMWQFYGPLYLPHGIGAMSKTVRWVIPGSRLLLTDRAATLLSGSSPGRWAYDQPVFLRETKRLSGQRDNLFSLFCVLCVFSRLFLVLLCSLFDELD